MPDPTNDKRNAEEYTKYKKREDLKSKIHLTLSATYPNLQAPGDIMTILGELENEFPKAFKWAGEINVIKHALVGNGFFKEDTSPRITKQFLDDGNLDPFFRKMEETQWPVTIHCDCGNIHTSIYHFIHLLLSLEILYMKHIIFFYCFPI